MRRLVLLSSAFVGLAIGALADTYVVNPQGTGDFPTIQAAINAAVDGDVIELTNGVFTGDENRGIDFLGKAITVRSQSGDPANCIIDCQGSEADPHRGFLFRNHESALSRLEGITITRAYARGNGGGILCDNAEPTLDHVIISDCFAWNGGGAALETTQGWPAWGATFVNCIFMRNSCDGPHCWGGAVLVQGLDAPADPTFVNCTFAHNRAGNGGGMICSDTYDASPALLNCTFYGNHAEFGSGICYTWLQPALVVENTILANGTGGAGVACDGPEVAQLACCDIYGNEGGNWVGPIADQYGINGNISEDPLFCNPASSDFHLQEDSPCAPFSQPNPECDLIGAWPVGCWSDVREGTRTRADHHLILSVPNPLSLPLRATYHIPESRRPLHVVCGVLDPAGRLVRTLEEQLRPVGLHVISWDGVDLRGRPVESGVYYLKFSAGTEILTKPIVVIR